MSIYKNLFICADADLRILRHRAEYQPWIIFKHRSRIRDGLHVQISKKTGDNDLGLIWLLIAQDRSPGVHTSTQTPTQTICLGLTSAYRIFFWQCVTAPTPEISSPFICSAFQVVCQLNEMRSRRLSCLLHCSIHSPTRKQEKHYDHYEKMTNILFFWLNTLFRNNSKQRVCPGYIRRAKWLNQSFDWSKLALHLVERCRCMWESNLKVILGISAGFKATPRFSIELKTPQLCWRAAWRRMEPV